MCKSDFRSSDIIGYMCSQLIGALAAAGTYAFVFDKTFQVAPVAPFTWMDACWVELFYTGFLCFCVLNTCLCNKNANNEYFGLTIGFSVVAGGYASGAISGGCLNPAIAIAADLASWNQGFGWSLAFALAQCIGAALAAILYRTVRPDEFGGARDQLLAKLIAEFTGTFVLVYTVGLNVASSVTPDTSHAALSIAAALMCSIYCLGSVSGAHFNPAVTIAVLCSGRNKISMSDALMYIATQLIAAIAAGFAFGLTTSAVGSDFGIGPGKGFTWWNLAFAEAMFTFVLAYTVLAVATARKSLEHFFGAAIGFCVIVGGYAVGPISGGHLNPAVTAGAAFNNVLNHHGNFVKAFGYWGAQAVGGALAAGVFGVVHRVEYDEDKLP